MLWFEPFILIACIYSFWFPSNFMADTVFHPSSDMAWLSVMIPPFIGLWGVWTLWSRRGTMRFAVEGIGVLVVALTVYALFVVDISALRELNRQEWFWLLAFFIPITLARYAKQGRLWSMTILDAWILAFFVLAVINIYQAPFEIRGLGMLARPALGVWLMIYLTELIREHRSIRIPFAIMTLLALIISIGALGTTAWSSKSDLFSQFTDQLFRFSIFNNSTFNPNEIGGAMSWLIPLMLGASVYFAVSLQQRKSHDRWRDIRIETSLFLALSILAFVLMMIALFLGQSRSALIGVIVALLGAGLLTMPTVRWRYITVIGVSTLILLQIGVFFNLFPVNANDDATSTQTAGVSNRDQRTLGQRFDIWESAFAIMSDYPLTGGGLNSFRYGFVRQQYPVRGFNMAYDATEYDPNHTQRGIPHTHNTFVQFIADMGIPGLLVALGLHLTLAYMLFMTWLKGEQLTRVAVIAVGAGILSQLIFGIADAIPLWDRFSFIFWLMVGLAVGLYVMQRDKLAEKVKIEE